MNSPQLEIDLIYHLDDATFGLQAIPDPRIHLAAAWIAKQFGVQRLYASIAIVDDETIQELNAEQLGHDWPTDVISFILDEIDGRLEGELVASAETAARVCIAAGWTVDDELLLYVVHGLLHVVGMEDLQPEQQTAMRRLEQACLLALGVTAAGEHMQRFDTVCNSEVDL